jgi:hypothetical protein
MTYDWRRKGGSGKEKSAGKSVRAYQIYYQGRPYALIPKEGIDTLLAHKLLKRQHTVELIEDFQAQRQGVGIKLLRSKDGGKTMLMRVEGPEPKAAPV